MKTIYLMILIFLILLFYLDYREKNFINNKENYCNKTNDSLNRTNNNNNSINFNVNTKKINYTTNGINPFIKCPQCFINFDCSNYPFKINDYNYTLCTTCLDKNNDKYKVLGKQAGRPRNCENLYN